MRINVATNVCSDGISMFHNQVYNFESSYTICHRMKIACYHIARSVSFNIVFLSLIYRLNEIIFTKLIRCLWLDVFHWEKMNYEEIIMWSRTKRKITKITLSMILLFTFYFQLWVFMDLTVRILIMWLCEVSLFNCFSIYLDYDSRENLHQHTHTHTFVCAVRVVCVESLFRAKNLSKVCRKSAYVQR